MTTMIEKVAEAILREQQNNRSAFPDNRDLARAAIEAMIEPTERMIAEGESAASFGIGRPADEEALPRVWKWMIEAALKEGK